ncbi:MAG: HD domain-containing protein [Candidatus Nanohaloarchaea archaeon]
MSIHIQDALHGYIELDYEEEAIVDRPELQRLRRIQQLGLSSLVYPSATHTRFQHSLGVMHTAGRFADSLGINGDRRKELRIAGLLHDSGHGPFSHASEVVAEKNGFSHEELSCKVVDELEDEFSVDSGRVKKIINGELEIGRVVAGDIDADRMDYLQRDAHATGVEYGQIDAATIIRLAEIDSRRLVFDYKGVQALESLLTARFHMLKSVYLHNACKIAEKMLERALENYVEENKVKHMMKMDDYEAHTELRRFENESGLYTKVSNRKLYKKALSLDSDSLSRETLKEFSEKSEQKLETEISEEAGLERNQVIVDLPSVPGSTDLNVRVKKEGEIRPMADLSPIPDALTEAEWQLVNLNVYCPETHRSKVSQIAKDIIL